MKPLRHTVPFGAGETPVSFASRLAAMRGLSAREFCRDFGIRFQKVVDGDPAALAVLAGKGGVDPTALAENAFVRTGTQRYRFKAEELTRENLRRATVYACPKCLIEDLAADPRGRVGTAAFQRARWQVATLKTCHIHRTALVVAVKDLTAQALHDWSHHIAKILPKLNRLADEADTRDPTPFETYVTERLHVGSSSSDLIDDLPLFVAIAACETFGAVATLGRTPNLKTLTEDQWRGAGAAGFAILTGGKRAAEDFLDSLQASFPYSRSGNEGPQAVYGRIYQTLDQGRPDPAYDPLRDLVGEHIRKRFPVGPGDTVFGSPVRDRTIHSIRTLSVETGLHRKRLRKLLKAKGVLSSASDSLADGYCLFDAKQGSQATTEAKAATLSLQGAGVHLNATRAQRDLLYKAGILAPRLRVTGYDAADAFAVEDLDELLRRLTGDAKPVWPAGRAQANIPDAAKAACCSAIDIVQALLDRRLTAKGLLANRPGYMGILVDLEEVRAIVRGPDLKGLPCRGLAERLRVSDRVALALIEGGHLRSVAAINPVNRCPVTIVPTKEIERFEREFVSLFALARQRRRHFLKVKAELLAAGVEPALDSKKVGATFYRAVDLSKAKL